LSDGWRTLIVESAGELSLENGCLSLCQEGKDTITFPLTQLSRILISSSRGSISVPLLITLIEGGIEVVFCDGKHQPVGELLALGNHSSSAGHIMEQAAWPQEIKDALWAQIVALKLSNQTELLRRRDIDIPDILLDLPAAVLPGDSTNREGQGARLYFSRLFGERFIRHSCDTVNNALDYGYTILLSAMTRLLSSYGYHTALGIHHCSIYNRFNLACDLMEPFRPFTDAVVCLHRGEELTWDYKKELIAVLSHPCRYKGKSMSVETAMGMFALDVTGAFSDSGHTVGALTFSSAGA